MATIFRETFPRRRFVEICTSNVSLAPG